MAIGLFLSYTWSKDTSNDIAKFHKELEINLKKRAIVSDLSIFYDKSNITSEGDESYFKPILQEHLDKSKVLIVLLSEAWLKSKWCAWEYESFSKNTNRLIIPILWNEYNKRKIIPHSEEIKKEIEDLSAVRFLGNRNMEVLSKNVADRIVHFLNATKTDVDNL